MVSLCLSKKASLSSWGEAVESQAQQAASRARRFQRWIDNVHVRVQALYVLLVQAALADWKPIGRVYVALDVSVIKDSPFALIRVSLIYRGRAIPLAWRVLMHASARVGCTGYELVLDQALAWKSFSWPTVALSMKKTSWTTSRTAFWSKPADWIPLRPWNDYSLSWR